MDLRDASASKNDKYEVYDFSPNGDSPFGGSPIWGSGLKVWYLHIKNMQKNFQIVLSFH